MIVDFAKTQALAVNSNLFASQIEAKSAQTMQISLVRNKTSGLIFNEKFDPNKVDYNLMYNNDQSASKIFTDHMVNVKEIIMKNMKRPIIEIGCGKGAFLEILEKEGLNVTGFDPTYEGENLNIIKEKFKPNIDNFNADLILRHVLEHIPDPIQFLSNITTQSCLIYIEVPSFEWIIENSAWYDITGEHVNYFTKNSLSFMFTEIIESGYLFCNQYVYVLADLAKLRKHIPNHTSKYTLKVNLNLDSIFKNDKEVVVWGAAGKGITFCYQAKLHGFQPKLLIDINPHKWNLYVPGSGIKISKPVDVSQVDPRNSIILVANRAYIEEVKAFVGNNYEIQAL